MQQSKCLSLLSAVDESIRLTQAEEAKINENIHQLREILHSMRTQPINAPKQEELSADAEEGVPPGERVEMELLERVLQRALRVRCGSGTPKGPGAAGKGDGEEVERVQATTDTSTNLTATKPASKPRAERTASQRCASASVLSKDARGQLHHRARPGRGSVARVSTQKQTVVLGKVAPPHRPGIGRQCALAPAAGELCHPQASLAGPQQRATQRGLCAEDSRQPPCKDPVPVTCLEGTGAGDGILSSTEGNGKPSVACSVWREHRAKHSRLWDKALIAASKPVGEKTRFTERLLSTFHSELPRSSLVDINMEVDRLVQLCGALTHCLQTEMQTARTCRPPGSGACWELQYESSLMEEGLAKVVSDLQARVDQLNRDAKAWDRWGPGACCPVRRRGQWGDPAGPDLPHVLNYTSEAELKELDGLRLTVTVLQQDIHLHQAMRETLTPCLTSGCPSAGMLRSLYSLLGEGGAQFPAVVVDNDPN
ncbi:hypothetical protein AAFF_G00419690 [Aldrovandia affinis]|uniref:Uncharacterized protein n=1 Tax=Aldrovandia affinis TaxID=143900 RepID=A0AAD7WJ28_9TELE|nr:hypothetical protein AAFF_G00419690 [Aldrovandia affinis]